MVTRPIRFAGVWTALRWTAYLYVGLCVIAVSCAAVFVFPRYWRAYKASARQEIIAQRPKVIRTLPPTTIVLDRAFSSEMRSLYQHFLDSIGDQPFDSLLPQGEVMLFYFPDSDRVAIYIGANLDCNCQVNSGNYNKLIANVTVASGHLVLGSFGAANFLTRSGYPIMCREMEVEYEE